MSVKIRIIILVIVWLSLAALIVVLKKSNSEVVPLDESAPVRPECFKGRQLFNAQR